MVAYVALFITSVLILRQVNEAMGVMQENKENFQRLLQVNNCVDEYTQVDPEVVGAKISHLDKMVSSLYAYTWIFCGLVWLPLTTPILFYVLLRMIYR